MSTESGDYLELTLSAAPDAYDVLIAELAELGFESFTEEDNNLQAFMPYHLYVAPAVQALLETYKAQYPALIYEFKTIPKTNWNRVWEENYEPVIVNQRCVIRAAFHQPLGYEIELIINPKMSFGTGHHATTLLCAQQALMIEGWPGKTVLDVGSGTGILGILADKLGAVHVLGLDIEEWAVENANENAQLNNAAHFSSELGGIETLLPEQSYNYFDYIFANINLNTLLQQIPAYSVKIKGAGYLIMSGFYEKDQQDIIRVATENSLVLHRRAIADTEPWACLVFKKAKSS